MQISKLTENKRREMQKLISMNEPGMGLEVSVFGASRGGDKFSQVLNMYIGGVPTYVYIIVIIIYAAQVSAGPGNTLQ